MKDGRRIAILAILAGIMFLSGIGHRDITTSHEARVAVTARQMADSGWPWNARPVQVPRVHLKEAAAGALSLVSDPNKPPMAVNPWGVPILDGHVRLQKPPLPYWCDAVMFRLFGTSEWAARFVPALLGALATLLLFDLTRMLFGRRMAWYAALIWLSSHFILTEYRKTMADPYLAFFTLGCIWAWVRAWRIGRPPARFIPKFATAPPLAKETNSHGELDGPTSPRRPAIAKTNLISARSGWLLLFYLGVGLGLLAKGPPLGVHLVIAIAAFHWCFRHRKSQVQSSRPWPVHAIGILLVLAIGLPWVLYVLRHVSNAPELWRYESVGEMTDNIRNARPAWFYFPQLFLLAMPWVGVWAAGLIYALVRKRRNHAPFFQSAAFFPLLWYVLTILFFSLVHMKKNAYLLPMIPAQTLLIAQGLWLMTAWTRKIKPDGWPRALAIAQAFLGLGAAIVLPALLILGRDKWFSVSIAILLCLAAAALAIYAVAGRRLHMGRWISAQAVSYLLLLFVFINFYTPLHERDDSPKPFAQKILPIVTAPDATLDLAGASPSLLFYLPATLQYNPEASRPYIVREIGKHHKPNPGALLTINGWQLLPRPILPTAAGPAP